MYFFLQLNDVYGYVILMNLKILEFYKGFDFLVKKEIYFYFYNGSNFYYYKGIINSVIN